MLGDTESKSYLAYLIKAGWLTGLVTGRTHTANQKSACHCQPRRVFCTSCSRVFKGEAHIQNPGPGQVTQVGNSNYTQDSRTFNLTPANK